MRAVAYLVPTFWTRGSGKELRGHGDAQMLALYLMTAPSSNIIGLYYLPLTTLLHETGLTIERFNDAMALVSKARLAYYDRDSALVWVPEAARYQIGDTMTPKDRRRGAVVRELSLFTGHRFADEFALRYNEPFGLGISVSGVSVETPTQGASENAEAPSADAATPPPPPLPPISSSGSDLDLPDRSGSQPVQPPAASRPAPSQPDRIPCPTDLKLLDTQVGQLEIGTGIPRWAIDALVTRFAGKYAGDPGDCRTIGDWRKGCFTAVCGDWSNPSKRPQKPTEAAPAVSPDDARKRAQDVEARAKANLEAKARERGAQRPQ